MTIQLSDNDSLDLVERVLDAGRASASDLAELQRRMNVAAELAEGLDDMGCLDDPAAELAAVRRGATVAAGLRVGALRRFATIEPDQAAALREAVRVHIEHVRTMRMLNTRRRPSA